MIEPTKILVVDDEPDLLATLRFRLEREGYDVVAAEDGVQALGLARLHALDLAVLDVMLPGENGYRVARMLREEQERGVHGKPFPIVLLTARDLSDDPDREEMFLEFSRADAMLYKPFDMADLLSRVRGLVAA